jgi:hypothetical protein
MKSRPRREQSGWAGFQTRRESDSGKHQMQRSAAKFPRIPPQNGVLGWRHLPSELLCANMFPSLPDLSETQISELSPITGKVQIRHVSFPLVTTGEGNNDD